MNIAERKAHVYKLIEAHYRQHSKTNMKKLRNSLGHHRAEDAVQEQYTRACTYWKSYDTDLDFDKWMSSILYNCVRDEQKDTILNGMVQDDLGVVSDPPRFDITDVVFANEIRQYIRALPVRLAYVLRLYLLEGYSGKEVAELTEFSPQAIRKMVSRFKEEFIAAHPQGQNV